MTDHEELLDISEAAAFLNVSETSLRRWTNSGRLRHLRVGRRRERRFRRADLLAFMEHGADADSRGARGNAETEGHAVVEGVPVLHGTHQCGFYASELGRLQLTLRFLSGGMRPGSACVLVSPKRFRAALLAELEATTRDVKRTIAAGHLLLVDYAKTSDAQIQLFDSTLRKALSAGARSLRIVGDVTDFAAQLPAGRRLGTRGRRDYISDFEADFSRFIAARFPVITLCTYDVRKSAGDDVYRALRNHPDSCQKPVERWLA